MQFKNMKNYTICSRRLKSMHGVLYHQRTHTFRFHVERLLFCTFPSNQCEGRAPSPKIVT